MRFKWLLLIVICLGACKPQLLLTHSDGTLPLELSKWLDPGEVVLSPGDKITISIWGHEDLSIGSSFEKVNTGEATGRFMYVSPTGKLELPLIGKVEVQNLTVREANLYIRELYQKFLTDPIVSLRVLSFSATVLGEVNHPGNYEFRQEQQHLIHSIGDAGGFTDYADLSRVVIYRRLVDQWQDYEVDLTDIKTLGSTSISVRPGDVIYIPPNGRKSLEKESSSWTPLISIISSVTLIISVILAKS